MIRESRPMQLCSHERELSNAPTDGPCHTSRSVYLKEVVQTASSPSSRPGAFRTWEFLQTRRAWSHEYNALKRVKFGHRSQNRRGVMFGGCGTRVGGILRETEILLKGGNNFSVNARPLASRSAHLFQAQRRLAREKDWKRKSPPSSYLKNEVDFPKNPLYVFEARDHCYNKTHTWFVLLRLPQIS